MSMDWPKENDTRLNTPLNTSLRLPSANTAMSRMLCRSWDQPEIARVGGIEFVAQVEGESRWWSAWRRENRR